MKTLRLFLRKLRREKKPVSAFEPIATRKIISSPEIRYLKMLNRGYKKMVAKKLEAQRYIKTRSAELIKKMDHYENGGNISAAIIDLRIELAENEIDECRKKIYNSDNKIGKEYHLPKKQRKTIKIQIADLEYNLKNLFNKRDLIFICL